MRKIKFIVNPVAGDGSSKDTIKLIHDKMEKSELSYSISISSYKGDVENLSRKAVEKGYTDIIAVGGDGTLLEAFNGLYNTNTTLGIIPTGTGNDFIRMLGITKNVNDEIDRIILGNTKVVDTGSVNGYHFLNIVGIGIDGDIIEKTENVKKFIKGPPAYIYATFSSLIKFKCKSVKITIDDQTFKKNVFLVAVGNGQYFGGGMRITPNAEVDNELLEVVIINKMPKPKFAILFRKVFTGDHIHEDVVEVYRGRNIKIETEYDLSIEADGNLVGKGNCDITIFGKSQKIIM
ncbi:MAG: diacylglycerol kinase family lipid kinase [Clostridia bacterium]|nr:diacylglycerol kinase family lipid kinase [Clostridia bacterium]